MKDLDKLWVGLVEDNVDPDRLGRVKIRVQSIFDDIPVEDIPWATPIKSLSARSFEVPAIGKIVSVFFPNDILYEPYYMYSDHYNINVFNKIKDMSDEEYVNFFAILIDHRTQIFADDTNLTMDYKYNKITIDNENINLELKDANQKLNIGTKNSTQQAVLGTRYFEWMDKFMSILKKPTSLLDSKGANVLKTELELSIAEYENLRKDFVSDYVNIVDNRKVEKLKRTPTSSSQMHDGVNINNNITNDPVLKEKIIEQFEKSNNELKESIPSSIIKKTSISSEDSSGNIVEGLSEVPFGIDSNEDINLYEKKGTETSFTDYDFKNIENYVQVMVPVSTPEKTYKYVTEEEAKEIEKKEQKSNGALNYNSGDETYEDQSDPDDIISGMAFENNDDVYDDSSEDIAENYDPSVVFTTDDQSQYVEKSTTSGGGALQNYATGTTKTGQKTKNVNGQIILNGEVPDKYMSKIQVGNSSGELKNTAKLEKHFALNYIKLNIEYMKKFSKSIYVTDSYRTYEAQVDVKRRKGSLAATPGRSLHGWGIAVDIGDSTRGGGISFDSEVYKWMDKNAPSFGIVNPSWARKGARQAEPWHWEYIVNDTYRDI